MTAPSTSSIVVTNHDYERHVAAAVRSALAQRTDDRDVEVIVVDDGSTDGSLDVLREFGDEITLVTQPNGGQGSAFNAGFATSVGDVIVFLDADDTLEPDLVARLIDRFADPRVGRVQFPLRTIDADGRDLGGTIPCAGDDLAAGDLRRELARFPDDLRWQPTTGNAFRRSVLESILPMPTAPYRICADYYLSNLSPLHGEVAVLDRPGGAYRIHGANRHHAEVWTLDAVRSNIVRTHITHRLLIDEATAAGLAGLPTEPDGFASVTALAHRLVSLRLDPAAHPFPDDHRWQLVRRGVAAARGRFDTSWARRVAMAGWFAVAGTAPTGLVPLAARPIIRIEQPHRWWRRGRNR
ncbi:MAG: glycosyltransferase [Actinomycetota bacterium]